MVQMVKNLPTMWETQVQSLGREDPLEKEMATRSSILAWRIPWTEEPGRLQSMESQRVWHDWVTNTFTWLIYSVVLIPTVQPSDSVIHVDIHTHIPYRILFSIMVLMGCFIWFSVLNNRTLLLIPNLDSWACLLHSPKSSTFNLFNLTFEPSWITSSVLNMLRAFSPLCPRPFF